MLAGFVSTERSMSISFSNVATWNASDEAATGSDAGGRSGSRPGFHLGLFSLGFRLPAYLGPVDVKSLVTKKKPTIEAVAYMRTSSASNVGTDKDSDKRQRAAITAFAKANGYVIVAEFYDAAVKGSDPVPTRPGFAAMMDRIAGNGVHTIIIESPDRFARDLSVQLAGHDFCGQPTSVPT